MISTKRYSLTPDLVSGNELIDSEHTQLFEAINNLLDACVSGHGRNLLHDTAQFLSDYVAKHFGDEEALQQQYHYPHYDAHHAFHVNYKKQLRKAVNAIELSGATIENLQSLNQQVNVLLNHIRREDKRVAAFVRDNS